LACRRLVFSVIFITRLATSIVVVAVRSVVGLVGWRAPLFAASPLMACSGVSDRPAGRRLAKSYTIRSTTISVIFANCRHEWHTRSTSRALTSVGVAVAVSEIDAEITPPSICCRRRRRKISTQHQPSRFVTIELGTLTLAYMHNVRVVMSQWPPIQRQTHTSQNVDTAISEILNICMLLRCYRPT